MFTSAVPIAQPLGEPRFFVEGLGEKPKRRCGRTFEFAYNYDQQFLFLNTLCDLDLVMGSGISSLFVRMSVYVAFFGSIPLGNAIGPEIPLVSKHFANNEIPTLDSHLGGPS
jgi:hypothetical protein